MTHFTAVLLFALFASVVFGITQLCVHPAFRRRGLARILLNLATSGLARQGLPEVSLTVTEANSPAIDLYRAEGFDSAHAFDATVWQRSRIA